MRTTTALAAGRPVVDQRRRTIAWCGALLAAEREDGGAGAPGRRSLALEIACGGVWDVIRMRVATGDIAGLRRDAPAVVAAATTCGRAVPV